MTKIDKQIVFEIQKALALMGAKNDLLKTIGSWKNEQSDEDTLASLSAWNDHKIDELKDRIIVGGASIIA